MRRKAFTLTELLVALGCLAVLISLAVPVISKARSSAKTAMCLSNLRQIGNAFTMYAADTKGQLVSYMWNTPGPPTQAYNGYWFGILDSYGVKGDGILCPAANQPIMNATRRGFGTATAAWTGAFAGNGTAIKLSPTIYRNGSYGYNRYLTAKGGFGPGGKATNLLNIPNLGDVPTFMDSTYADVSIMNGIAQVPVPIPSDFSGKASVLGAPAHYEILIARHGTAINVGMADGSARTVPLQDLYELTWSGLWQKYELPIP